MTEPTRKPKNMAGILDEYTASARIARLLSGSAAALLDVEKAVREATEKKRRTIQEEILSLVARVPEDKRDRIAKLVLAGGSDLCGFRLASAANDAPAPADQADAVLGTDGDKSWLTEEPKPATRPIVIDRSIRR